MATTKVKAMKIVTQMLKFFILHLVCLQLWHSTQAILTAKMSEHLCCLDYDLQSHGSSCIVSFLHFIHLIEMFNVDMPLPARPDGTSFGLLGQPQSGTSFGLLWQPQNGG